jgi:hypothetical protein
VEIIKVASAWDESYRGKAELHPQFLNVGIVRKDSNIVTKRLTKLRN